ncbi:MAG: hypothetical protein WCP08_15605 [Prolixibacteraceae bacterium]
MKKILALVSILMVLLVVSCEKNVITFGSTDIKTATSAEVRLVYDIPVVSTSALNITRLKYNNQLVSEVSTAIGSIFPNSTAKYHVVPQGAVKVDAFTGTTKDVLQYSNTFTVGAGKYTAFIHSLTDVPFVVKDADAFPSSDAWADTTSNIQFVNLLYKADGVTPYGKLTLKGKRGAGTTASPFVYITIATCGFKEASTLIPYKLLRNGIAVWSGTETGMVFTVFDDAGVQLKYFPTTTGALTDWTATAFSLGKGKNYIFHLNGKMGAKYADQAIRLSTVALN